MPGKKLTDSKELLEKIKSQSKTFVEEFIKNPTENDYFLIENAMLQGSIIAMHLNNKKSKR